MAKTIDLDEIYKLRKDFIIIGLTGRTGSGCTYIADTLECNDIKWIPEPNVGNTNNNERKYKIAHKYLTQNWSNGFEVIKYKNVICLMILREFISKYEHTTFDTNFDDLISFFGDKIPKDDFVRKYQEEFGGSLDVDYGPEIIQLQSMKEECRLVTNKFEELGLACIFDDGDISSETKNEAYLFFKSKLFTNFCTNFNNALMCVSLSKRIVALNIICNYFRERECIFCPNEDNLPYVYSIAKVIDYLIQGFSLSNSETRMVIDSLRNPLEVMYFKEKYSSFFMMSLNIEDSKRKDNIKRSCSEKVHHTKCESIIYNIDSLEYSARRGDFHKQDVGKCIQFSELHISNLSEDYENANLERFPLLHQLVLFCSLMFQPGLVTPSKEERSMQMAHTAKYNSGCISRQVGAVITDENFSIKSVGWNNTPKEQVPCLLRNVEDLIDDKDKKAFSNYELSDEFKNNLLKVGYSSISLPKHNCSFCFKSIRNSMTEGKNQVHTRSLHAEENAMLQITKYGGQAVKDGFLFTTASPCELCSKKAYQLGIKEIFFIDPYPGIAKSHILESGGKRPTLTPFNGAIGKSYFKLYEPFMAYKDELMIRTGIVVKNKVDTLKEDLQKAKDEIERLKAQLDSTESK